MILWALLSTALASDDEPHLWVRGFGAVAYNPLGVMVDTAVEARAPILRVGGPVNNMTFIGAGARVAVTPVHTEGAARLSIQPVDVLPVTVEAFYGQYWESPWGLVPTDRVAGNAKGGNRALYRSDRDFAASTRGFIFSPTFQIAAGPFVGFTNAQVAWVSINAPDNAEPWIFEPYRGVVMSATDRVLDHTSAVLVQPLDGKEKPLVRVGAALRGRSVQSTTDVMLQLGAIGQYRPGSQDQDLTMTLIVAGYLRDPDFLGPLPYFALAFNTTRLIPFKKKGPAGAATASVKDALDAFPM